MNARFDLWRQSNRKADTWRYLSLRYQHKSDNLWKQYQEGKIDHSRYLELLEQIKNEELTDENKRHWGLLSPEGKERIETDIWEYENAQQKIREREALPPLERYKEDVPQTIVRYRQEANYYRRIANILQIIIIVGSVLVTSATSAAGFSLFGDIIKWIAAVISIVVAASAGLTGYFKFRERSFNLQQTADAIEQEHNAVTLGRRSYQGKQPNEALELFTDRVEFLIEEQKKRQQQLEQPPDMKCYTSLLCPWCILLLVYDTLLSPVLIYGPFIVECRQVSLRRTDYIRYYSKKKRPDTSCGVLCVH